MMVTLGIITSDLACVLICSLAAPLVSSSVVQLSLTAIGTIILLVMGIKYLVKPIQYTSQTLQLQPNQYLGFFSKGFLVNFTSPFTFAYWLGAVAYGNGNYTRTFSIILFITAILAGIFTIDVLKVLLAKYLQKIIQPKTLKIISIACGIVLIGFAIRMAWYLYAKG
jgi:threonine/homoserine/homoserine lactone efflux protein